MNGLETFKHQDMGFRGLQVQSFKVSRERGFTVYGHGAHCTFKVVEILTDDYCTAN